MAVEFDATDSFIQCLSGATIDDLTTITMATWVFIDTIGAGVVPVLAGKAGAVKSLRFYNDADIGGTGDQCAFSHTFSGTDGLWRTVAPTLGAWVHLVLTYNNTATTNNPSIYYGGGAQTVVDNVGDPTGTADADAAGDFIIGAVNSAGAQPFDGKIDDFRYYGRILTANEIIILASGYRGPLGGELIWLSTDDFKGIGHPDGTTLTVDVNFLLDLSGNGNDGNPALGVIARASDAPRMNFHMSWNDLTGIITVALTGAVSTITGSLTKDVTKVFAGSVSTITGAIVKDITKVLTGAVSSIVGAISILATIKKIWGYIVVVIAPAAALLGITAPTTDVTGTTAPTTAIEEKTRRD